MKRHDMVFMSDHGVKEMHEVHAELRRFEALRPEAMAAIITSGAEHSCLDVTPDTPDTKQSISLDH